MKDKAEGGLSCSLRLRKQKKNCIWQIKKLAIQLQGEHTQLSCSNKLCNVRNIIYKLFSVLLDLFTISSQHWFTLLTKNAAITVSQ